MIYRGDESQRASCVAGGGRGVVPAAQQDELKGRGALSGVEISGPMQAVGEFHSLLR